MTPTVLVPALLLALAVTVALPPPARPRWGRDAVRGPGARSAGTATRGSHPPSAPSAPGAVVTGTAALGVGAGVAFLLGSGTGLVLGVVAVPVAWRWLARLEPGASRRRREQLEEGLPLLVDLLAACLRAGQAPGSALAAVTASLEPGPLRAESSRVVARLRLGGDPLTTWRALGAHPQLGPLGRTVARALDGGASVADAMGDLAEDLRRSRRAAVQARARSVGARAAAPLGLCLLPAFVLVGIVPVVAGSLGALLQR
jgi:Flp pilus assembly protein TadB